MVACGWVVTLDWIVWGSDTWAEVLLPRRSNQDWRKNSQAHPRPRISPGVQEIPAAGKVGVRGGMVGGVFRESGGLRATVTSLLLGWLGDHWEPPGFCLLLRLRFYHRPNSPNLVKVYLSFGCNKVMFVNLLQLLVGTTLLSPDLNNPRLSQPLPVPASFADLSPHQPVQINLLPPCSPPVSSIDPWEPWAPCWQLRQNPRPLYTLEFGEYCSNKQTVFTVHYYYWPNLISAWFFSKRLRL